MDLKRLIDWFWVARWPYHVLFWVSYNGFWHFVSTPEPTNPGTILVSLIILLFNAGAVYTNLYYLMPKWLYKRKYLVYAGLLVLNIAGFIVLLTAFLYLFFYLIEPQAIPRFFQIRILLGAVVMSTMGSVFLAMGLKLAKRQIETERRNEKLEKEKMATELKFLKSQFNPHFMFNGLNNIYFLIKRDPEKAAESLATFSDMLRYQLYECNDTLIPLTKEIEFIENYIHFAQLRHDRLDISTEWSDQVNGQQIAPLLFLPLVENAFKHVSHYRSKPNLVDFKLDFQGSRLHFRVKNTCNQASKKEQTAGGIGLSNLHRRLELLYPKSHQLRFHQEDDTFEVDLQLHLN